MSALRQADVETITRSWSLTDGAGGALIPGGIEIHARSGDATVVWTTDGAGETINGIVNNGDGTGKWTIAAGDLAEGNWRWWALVNIDGDRRIPQGMTGQIVIADR